MPVHRGMLVNFLYIACIVLHANLLEMQHKYTLSAFGVMYKWEIQPYALQVG